MEQAKNSRPYSKAELRQVVLAIVAGEVYDLVHSQVTETTTEPFTDEEINALMTECEAWLGELNQEISARATAIYGRHLCGDPESKL